MKKRKPIARKMVRGSAAKVAHGRDPSIAKLKAQLEKRTRELTESLDQQAATSEVLKIISSPTFNLQNVFDTLMESATRLCRATAAVLWLPGDDGRYRLASEFGVREATKQTWQALALKPEGRSIVGRCLQAGHAIYVPDHRADPTYDARNMDDELTGGLCVPLMREGAPIGVLVVGHKTRRRFTKRQIALLTTFADQAVIAIENFRLLSELRERTQELRHRTDDLSEALEQQTALSEVLSVISSSPGELKPIFDAILENATRICEAQFGNLFLREGDKVRAVAVIGIPSFVDSWQRDPVMELVPNTPSSRVLGNGEIVQIPDMRKDEGYLRGDG